MVEIEKIDSYKIEFKGITIEDTEKIETVSEICHRHKHLYKEGFPVGRKTRRENHLHLKKWDKCPEIVFTYLLVPKPTPAKKGLVIKIIASDLPKLLKRYTQKEIDHFAAMYTQSIAEEIIRSLNTEANETDETDKT